MSESVIAGSGSGIYYYADTGIPGLDIYNGSLWYFHIGAVFNPKTCMLSGVIMNVLKQPVFADGIEYFYDGVGLSGHLVSSAAIPGSPDRAVDPYYSDHNATYIVGPVSLPLLPPPPR